MIGRSVSHYKITQAIGSGGMGIVFEAEDIRLDRRVALKILPEGLKQTPGAIERFQREARAASALSHPNICMIHDIGSYEGHPFIVMERLEGQTLEDEMKAGPMQLERVLHLAIQIVNGLRAAHTAGIVHRDIKPSNIFITRDGFVKILDFGLAKLDLKEPEEDPDLSPTELTQAGTVVGTVNYLSPEQALSQPLDFSSDLFSFGVVLYYMVTGDHPFRRETPVATLNAIINHPPDDIRTKKPKIPRKLDQIIRRLLEKKPEDRFQDTNECAVALESIQKGDYFLQIPALRAWKKWTVLIAGIILAAVALAYYFSSGRSPGFDPESRLAVLPLQYDGPDDQSALSTMFPALIFESIRSRSDVKLIPFDSSRFYRPATEYSVIAEELDADWVLQGSLTIVKNQFVSTFHLLGPEGTVVWKNNVSGNISDLFSVSENLTRDLSKTIGSGLSDQRGSFSQNPKSAQHYLNGISYLEGWDIEKNYERAKQSFQLAIQEDEEFGLAYAGLALAYWDEWNLTGEPEAVTLALKEANRAVELEPDRSETFVALGTIQLGRGRTVEAMRSFELALEKSPADEGICRKIAEAYEVLGDYENAKIMYQRAIDLRPDFWQNYLSMGNFLLYKGEFENAKTYFRDLIRLRPQSDIGHNNLALSHLSLGEMEEAETYLHAALAIQPNFSSYNNLGFVYYSQKKYQAAAEQFKKATETGGAEEAWINLGDAYRQLKEMQKAKEAYRKAVELTTRRVQVNPADAFTRASLAYSLAGFGRCKDARTEIEWFSENASQNPLNDYYLAIASSLCNYENLALKHIRSAMEGGLVADVRTNPDLEPLLNHPTLEEFH